MQNVNSFHSIFQVESTVSPKYKFNWNTMIKGKWNFVVNLAGEFIVSGSQTAGKKLIENKSYRLSSRMSIVHKNISICRYCPNIQISRTQIFPLQYLFFHKRQETGEAFLWWRWQVWTLYRYIKPCLARPASGFWFSGLKIHNGGGGRLLTWCGDQVKNQV